MRQRSEQQCYYQPAQYIVGYAAWSESFEAAIICYGQGEENACASGNDGSEDRLALEAALEGSDLVS